MHRVSALLLTFILVSGVSLAQSPTKETVLIKAGKMVDVRSGRVLTDQAILIEGGRIKQVGSAQSIQAPAGARVIDLSNATVLPGLIDCHTHLLLHEGDYDEQLLKESMQYRAIRSTVAAKKTLEAGFTTVRDVETEGAMYGDV